MEGEELGMFMQKKRESALELSLRVYSLKHDQLCLCREPFVY